jgi:pantoate--beta-alanine ligase
MTAIVRDRAEMTQRSLQLRRDGLQVGLVPTMGALHEGHLSLVRKARQHCDRIIVSIFVNPLQFGPNEDYLRYPRNEEHDIELLRGEGVDVVYVPAVATIYPKPAEITIDPGPTGQTFEGQVRPGHFRGVLTVVSKLFHHVQPQLAVFGQKDAQQIFLIRQMVSDLDFPVEIVESDTVRDTDGLALSSRNAYLKVAERKRATILYKALCRAESEYGNGVRSLAQLRSEMINVLAADPEAIPEYLTAVDEATFHEADPVSRHSRLIGAIRLGSVRLIDNIRVSA